MNSEYSNFVKRIAQVGLIAKGIVYMLFGVLIFIAAYGGEKHIRLFGIVKYFISLGPYSRLMITMLALGLFCYSLWKLLQMVLNTEAHPRNFRGYFIRATWIGPFVFYLALGSHAVWQLYKYATGSFVYPTADGMKELVDIWWGRYVIGFIALTLFFNSMSLFYLAFTGKYRKMLTGEQFYTHKPQLARMMGFVGYFFYGLALLIIALLFTYSLYTMNEHWAQGGLSLFSLLKTQPFGTLILTAIAIGTICYGIYFFLASYFRWNRRR